MTKEDKNSFDHTGSSFDQFLAEEGILAEVEAAARERIRASIEETQRDTCHKYGASYFAVSGDSKLGFAASTEGNIPINGLRHPPSRDTSGWFLWCGTEFSEAADFFVPLHVWHVYEKYPNLTTLLGLPPGYRFLVDGECVDVWYDARLLEV